MIIMRDINWQELRQLHDYYLAIQNILDVAKYAA